MVKIDLADKLTLTLKQSGLDLEVSGADLSPGQDNLVRRAARAFFKAAGLAEGADMRLEKKIPIAAGLGGGSSDAAAALLGLNHVCGRPLSLERLSALGLSLGADVPFFLYPWAAAWAEGIGEKLRPGPVLGPAFFLLVNPGWELSTSWVYKSYKLKLTNAMREHIYWSRNESSFTREGVLHNDLETVVLPRYPELELIKEKLLAAGASNALMTGSGPTIFGVFFGRRDLERARVGLEEEGRGKWIVIPAAALSGPEARAC